MVPPDQPPTTFMEIVKHRNFVLYAVGQATSQLGSLMSKVGLALYVLHATGSAGTYSTVLAVAFLPTFCLYPFSGVLVDRVDRRRLLIGLDLARGAYLILLLTLCLVKPMGLWTVLAYVLFQAVCDAFANPAGNTIIPFLFEPRLYALANAANAWGLNAVSLLAPALGVWSYSMFGLRGILLMDAVSFFAGAACSSLLRLRKPKSVSRAESTFTQIKEGFSLLRRRELALPTLAICVSRACIDPVASLAIPFLLLTVLHRTDQSIAYTQGATMLGLLLAPGLVLWLRARYGTLASLHWSRSGKVLVYLAYGGIGYALVTFPAASQGAGPVVFFSLVCLAGAFFNTAGFAFLNTHFQTSVSVDLMGRFAAVRFMAYALVQPLGLKLYGSLLDGRWYPLAFGLAAAGAILETLLLLALKQGGRERVPLFEA